MTRFTRHRTMATRFVRHSPLILTALLGVACSSTAQIPRIDSVPDQIDPAEVVAAPEPFASSTAPGGALKSPAAMRVATAGPPSHAAKAFIARSPVPSAEVVEASLDAAMGPGVTTKSITFGIPMMLDEADALEAIGTEDRGVAEATAWHRAHRLVARAINENGGVLGRKVVPLFFNYRYSDYSSDEELGRAMCSYFTEDNEVLATYSGGLGACMEDTGGVNFLRASVQIGLDTYRKYPHTVGPVTMSLDRIAANYVRGLHAEGFFERGDRVGLVSWDTPTYDRVIELVLKPALARIGVELAAEAQVVPPDNSADTARAVADGEAVVVRFKSQEINKVLLLGSYSGRNKFMELAEAHEYRPIYGLYTHTGSDAGLSEKNERQLWGSVGVGWVPLSDVAVKEGLELSPAARRCRALMRAGGLGDLYDHADTAWGANSVCDFWLFFKSAIEAGAPEITADSIVRGSYAVSTFAPALTFVAEMAPGRSDGVAAVRHFRYFRECGCFHYTSPLYRAE